MRTAVKALLMVILALALMRADGLQYINLPYPDIIAPIFGMWAGAHEDAIVMELVIVVIECILIATVTVFGSDWLLQRARNSN